MAKTMTKDLIERLDGIEEKIKGKFFEMEKRVATLEAVKPEGMEERIKEVEDLQMLSQLEIMKFNEHKTEPAAAAAPVSLDLEKRLTGLLHRIDGLESQKMTDKSALLYVSKIVSEKKEIEKEFDRMRTLKKDFEAILKEKDEISKKIADSELNLEKVDALYSKMKTMDERLSVEMDKIYSMMNGIEERINESVDKANSIRKTVESRMALAEEKFKLRGDKMETLRDSLNAKLTLVDDKIRELDSFRKLIGDVNSFRAGMDEEAVQRIALEKSLQDLHRRIDDVAESMDTLDVKKQLEDEYVTVVSLEKKLQDFSRRFDAISSSASTSLDSKIKGLEAKIKETPETKQIRDLYAKLDNLDARLETGSEYLDVSKAITDLSEKLSSIEAQHKELKEAQALTPDKMIDEAMQRFEQEVEQKISGFSSKVDELGMKMQLEKEQITKALNMDELMKIRNDVVTQKRMMRDIERNLEISAARFFTENLEEFAKEIDKKLPRVVTHEDFVKEIKALDGRLKRIHAPDTSGIEQRLAMFERKINDVYAMTRNFSIQQPIIVE